MTVCEMMWIKCLMEELALQAHTPMYVFYDNNAAIYISNNPVFHEKTKHIEIDCHFIREKVMAGLINPIHVYSKDPIAEVLTKVVSRELFNHLFKKWEFVIQAV